MKRTLFIIVPSLVLAVILFLLYQLFFNKNTGKGALQVTASPESKLYLNGKFIGQTPFPKSEGQNIFPSGDYTLRLVPNDTSYAPYEEKITITRSTLTVVDRKFGESGVAEGSVISLLPLPSAKDIQLLVLSFPEKANVYVDSNMVGTTPLLLKDLTQSDHKLKIKADGYREKLIPIRTPEGYKLQVVAYLGIDTDVVPSPTTSIASPSATPTPTGSGKKVVILKTSTGFLRVRDEASISGTEIGRVSPGESYTVIDEKTGWYSIKLSDGKVGWISSDFAKLQ
jgi:hypothetical protein